MPSFKILEKNRRDCVTVQQQQQQQQQHTTLVKIASELTKQELKRHDENVFEASLRLKTNFHSVFWYNKPLSIKRERARERESWIHSQWVFMQKMSGLLSMSRCLFWRYTTRTLFFYLSLTHPVPVSLVLISEFLLSAQIVLFDLTLYATLSTKIIFNLRILWNKN